MEVSATRPKNKSEKEKTSDEQSTCLKRNKEPNTNNKHLGEEKSDEHKACKIKFNEQEIKLQLLKGQLQTLSNKFECWTKSKSKDTEEEYDEIDLEEMDMEIAEINPKQNTNFKCEKCDFVSKSEAEFKKHIEETVHGDEIVGKNTIYKYCIKKSQIMTVHQKQVQIQNRQIKLTAQNVTTKQIQEHS